MANLHAEWAAIEQGLMDTTSVLGTAVSVSMARIAAGESIRPAQFDAIRSLRREVAELQVWRDAFLDAHIA